MASKKTPGVAKKKVNWKIYLRNTWQLYVMMLIPIIWLICFKYKPMLYIVVAFKKYNIFKGIWESPWLVLNISRRHSDQVSSGLQ